MGKGWLDSAIDTVSDVASSASSTVNDVVDYGSNAANSAIDTASDYASGASDYVSDKASGASSWFGEMLEDDGEAAQGADDWINENIFDPVDSWLWGGDEDKEEGPVSVPFEEMTPEQGAEMDARNEAHQAAVSEWSGYDQGCREANQRHEQELATWRVAIQKYNNDPINNPSPGDRPRLALPPPPSSTRPPSMGSYTG